MNTKALFSSNTDLWATPQGFFDQIDSEFHFTLDAAAIAENTKCDEFFSPDDDSLKQIWSGRVWVNPPYGKNVGAWVRKASESAKNGTAEVVVMLLPARTDTKWFHEYVYNNAEIRFVKGRLKFGGAKYNAPFPVMVVIFRGDKEKHE